jgi:sigma-B regulation protein RsbU (phosphoserine phosphatase)
LTSNPNQSAEYQKSFDLKQIEFQAVLDLTIAINQNKPEHGLYLILENYLLEKLGIGHFSLFFFEELWRNTFSYGKVVQDVGVLKDLEHITHVSILSESASDFSKANSHLHHIIPVFFDRQLKGIVLCSRSGQFQNPFDKEAIALIQTLLSLMVMAVENQKLLAYRFRQEALRKEIEIARQVQQMLFPKSLPDTEHLKIYTTYLPHLDVSGDYYDYIQLNERQFAICVADVSGKGMSAALLMSNFQACLRTMMMEKKELASAVRLVNTILCQNSNQERFITSFIALFDFDTRILSYINSGHTPPCVIFQDGRMEQLSKGSTILGIFPDLPSLSIGELRIDEEVLLVAYTDGLTEVENSEDVEFGIEKIEEFLVENRNEKLVPLHQRLLNRLEFYAGDSGFSDDITLLTARIRP